MALSEHQAAFMSEGNGGGGGTNKRSKVVNNASGAGRVADGQAVGARDVPWHQVGGGGVHLQETTADKAELKARSGSGNANANANANGRGLKDQCSSSPQPSLAQPREPAAGRRPGSAGSAAPAAPASVAEEETPFSSFERLFSSFEKGVIFGATR